MFENEIKFISDFSHNKLKKFGSFVTFEKLSATDLHPAILSYISAELDYMIFRDRKKVLEDSIFDYSGREIADHFKIIAKEIKQNKKILIEDAKKLIIQAVSFNINYVVRPKWSAAKLIYNDQDFISVDELEQMLKYLYYYDYIKNVLAAYISKRKVIQLTLTEFDLILNKIDRELFKSNAEELINNALHSIGDFYSIGGINKSRVSLSAVAIFLKEKNLMEYLLKLRQAIPNGGRKKYEIEDIKKVLYSTTPVTLESISGYEAGTLKKEDEIVGDRIELEEIITDDKEVEDKQESMLDDKTIIVTEEKIKSPDETGKKITDNTEEDLLPVEEEFQLELLTDDTEEQVAKKEEIEVIVEEDIGERDNEQPKEFKEESIENKLKNDDEVQIEDELLTFYEQELDSMEEDLEEFDDLETEKNHSWVNDEIQIIEEEKTPETATEDKKETELTEDLRTELSDKNVFNKDDFDLSIFEGSEDSEAIDDILEKINGEKSQEEISENADVELDQKLVDENQAEIEVTDDNVEYISYNKKIIDEMLEDYFGADDKSPEETTSETDLDTVDEDKLHVQEKSEAINEDDSIEKKDKEEKPEEETDLFDTELASSILKGSSIDNDISSMLDEIDDLIEENTVASKELQDENDEEPALDEIQHPPVTDTSESQSDSEDFDKQDKVEKPIQKINLPIREKDLLSYLSRKEVKKIVSNVFGGDEEDFVTTIEKISELGSYKEATEILKGVFFTYRISPYSKESVILTNAVSHFFRQV